MFSVSISYEEAVERHKKVKLRQKIKVRLGGGKLYLDVAYWCREFARYRDKQTLKGLLRVLSIFMFGGKTVNFFWRKGFTDEQNKIIRGFVPRKNQILYHWTAIDFVEEIQNKGLVPGRAHQYVYLTDDPEYMEHSGFLFGKTRAYGHDSTFVALEVAAEELLKSENIYQMAEEHEFVVKCVPAACIGEVQI